MKLIDIDKLVSDYIAKNKSLQNVTWFELTDYEVKAIPIETIKKEIERLKEDIKWAWYYGNTVLDKMEYLKMWLEIKLKDWEKENEL